MTNRLYDAHNHLQDERLGERPAELLETCRLVGLTRMVVNGACEADWPQVLALAQKFPVVLPSFGCHPWYLHERTPHWLATLTQFLDAIPSAIGEIGLDRWKPDLSYAGQEAAFLAQLQLAAERNLPVSIHCLQTWGRLLELLASHPLPARGFLLHSYGGPREMVNPLAKLGAYFSFPGYYAHKRKERQREAFRQIPIERLLIETDAPDQLLPDQLNHFPLTGPKTGKPVNHPANLAAVYAYAAQMRGLPIEVLTGQVEQNFQQLFAGL